ncbi:MAG: Rnase Y domain-containing protein, partial [Myxococcales bacterium]
MAVVIPLLLAVFVVALLVGRALRAPALAQSEEEKQRLIEAAKSEAESLKRQAALDAKELAQKARADVEAQQKARQRELDRLTAELGEKERETERRRRDLERQLEDMARSEKQIAAREAAAEASARAAAALAIEAKARLEKTAGLSQAEARQALTDEIHGEARLAAVAEVKRIEDEARAEAENRSKTIIAAAIQRYAGEYVTERTVSTVPLPSDDMKGRIIGREGRNIRAFEKATGVDVIVDDTPGVVIVSGFDNVRREVAKLALDRLILDGRIHPTRIE